MTLKDDVPVKTQISAFSLKQIDKDKLYAFLREMEFNRLLSQAITNYGEPKTKIKNTIANQEKIDREKYITLKRLEDLDSWIKLAEKYGEIAVDNEKCTGAIAGHAIP